MTKIGIATIIQWKCNLSQMQKKKYIYIYDKRKDIIATGHPLPLLGLFIPLAVKGQLASCVLTQYLPHFLVECLIQLFRDKKILDSFVKKISYCSTRRGLKSWIKIFSTSSGSPSLAAEIS